jgi:hypothetical protein
MAREPAPMLYMESPLELGSGICCSVIETLGQCHFSKNCNGWIREKKDTNGCLTIMNFVRGRKNAKNNYNSR